MVETPTAAWVHGDAIQLQQAIFNLAANARDAMPGGGTLAITVRSASPEDRADHADHADPEGRVWLLEVRDTGEGMTREEARRFNRADGARRRARNFTYKFKPDDDAFQFRLTFPKSEVEPSELIHALQEILRKLESELGDDEVSAAETPSATSPRVRRKKWTCPRPK